ncbi:MAG: hypothetical protein KJZ93_06770 [Caldilineaceae bacterium]|nr:hypothetical protein [Caldilineaceae bacterium]
MAGVTLEVSRATGGVLRIQATDESGAYRLGDLLPGAYVVRALFPPGPRGQCRLIHAHPDARCVPASRFWHRARAHLAGRGG